MHDLFPFSKKVDISDRKYTQPLQHSKVLVEHAVRRIKHRPPSPQRNEIATGYQYILAHEEK